MSNSMKKPIDSYEDINYQDLQDRIAIANLLELPTTATWKQISVEVFKEIFKQSNNSNKKPEFISESPKLLALQKYFERLRQEELELKKEILPKISKIKNSITEIINEENIFITKKPVGEKIINENIINENIYVGKPEGRTERFAREKQLAEDMGKGRKKYNTFTLDEISGKELSQIKGLAGAGIKYIGGKFIAETGIKIISNPKLYTNHPLKSVEIEYTIHDLGKAGDKCKTTIHYLDYRK